MLITTDSKISIPSGALLSFIVGCQAPPDEIESVLEETSQACQYVVLSEF